MVLNMELDFLIIKYSSLIRWRQQQTTTGKQRGTENKKTARFLAERQLFLIRPCSGSASAPALVLHPPCSQGFIAQALSVSSRSYTSTGVAAGVKAGEKVKPGRQRKRTKEEEKGSTEWAGEMGKKQDARKKLKAQRK